MADDLIGDRECHIILEEDHLKFKEGFSDILLIDKELAVSEEDFYLSEDSRILLRPTGTGGRDRFFFRGRFDALGKPALDLLELSTEPVKHTDGSPRSLFPGFRNRWRLHLGHLCLLVSQLNPAGELVHLYPEPLKGLGNLLC